MSKYETAKSIILALLVIASGFFSWNLWTYQSNYETLEKSSYIKEVFINSKEDVANIVKADRVFYHQYNNHYGTDNTLEIKKIMSHLTSWDYYNLQDITHDLSTEDFFSLVHGNGTIELVFPTLVPIEQFKNILNFEEKKIPSFNFDRIIVSVNENNNDDSKIFFAAYKSKVIYSSNVNSQLVENLREGFYDKAPNGNSYLSYDTGQRIIFVNENSVELPRNKYLLNLLNVDLFRDALFTNPNVVQKTFLTSEDEYTDTSTMMTANYSTRLLSYVNPMAETNSLFSTNELLEKSIDFINDHAGWTDDYYFADATNQKIVYRLYTNGKPVFNEYGMSEISQIWGMNKIYKYTRPYFTVDILITSETSNVTLPSGESVISYLEALPGFNIEMLQDLRPAYKMVKDSDEPRIIVLEPAWYYLYNGVWGQIAIDNLGGNDNGLE